jgi:arylsulfatase A-like enzyme
MRLTTSRPLASLLVAIASSVLPPHIATAQLDAGTSGITATAPQAQPNLVLIIADDLGYADVGFNGCEDIPTPGIDRIAREGARFTDAYVTAAVCGPSRAGLITGRHQDRFGSCQNPTVDPSVPNNGVPTTERNIAELLRPAGYTSIAVGKWHLGTYPGLHPQDRGFDQFYGFLTGGHDYFPENLTLEDLSEVNEPWAWYRTKLLDNGVRVGTKKYLTDELSDRAVRFIDDHEQGPFFLYLCYNAPHTPLQATEEYLARFPDITDKKRRTYAAMVSAMDDGIARVLDALDRKGFAANTLVVFLSDNGGADNNASRNTPLRGYKASPFEGGIRVPFALRWPGVAEAGAVFEHPISSMDIAATIVEAAGPLARAQVRETHPLDGVDLRPFLSGERDGRPHDTLFWRWVEKGHAAVRHGDLKLIARGADGGGDLLFNLADDESERRNLLRADLPAISPDPLHAALAQWFEQLVPPAYPPLGSWKFND